MYQLFVLSPSAKWRVTSWLHVDLDAFRHPDPSILFLFSFLQESSLFKTRSFPTFIAFPLSDTLHQPLGLSNRITTLQIKYFQITFNQPPALSVKPLAISLLWIYSTNISVLSIKQNGICVFPHVLLASPILEETRNPLRKTSPPGWIYWELLRCKYLLLLHPLTAAKKKEEKGILTVAPFFRPIIIELC